MQRIWDIHVLFPRNFQKPDEDPQTALDHMAERLLEVGTVKASLLCPTTPPGFTPRAAATDEKSQDAAPSFPPVTHESCIEMSRKHGDLFVPHAVVDPQEHGEFYIHELHEMGYRGLKIIGTRKPYDDPSFFPTYK